ncbi:MAG: Holliday junction branch migration protein RuvA [Candidatus Nanopelagicales bacterium]
MIASVSGAVAGINPSSLVVEVGGVGVLVACTPQTAAAASLGDTVSLHTSLVVREDSLTLYGFADTDQRDAFELVQTVSGIGPRTALAVLTTLPPPALRTAIVEGDVAVLTRIPGIGTKGAQRMIIELKDRLPMIAGDSSASEVGGTSVVHAALVSLGWSAKDADRAVAAVATDGAAETSVLLRDALRFLDRR